MKIIVNKEYGGFALSTEAVELYEKYSGKEYNWVYIDRADKDLVKVVEELGSERSSGCFSKLKFIKYWR